MTDLVAQGPVILTLKIMDLGLEHFALEHRNLKVRSAQTKARTKNCFAGPSGEGASALP
jgi:hypothetical protein